MAEEPRKVCDVCRARPATYYALLGGSGEMRARCTSCFGRLATPEEEASHQEVEGRLRSARCEYCGAPAVHASIGCEIPGVLEEEAHFHCEQCLRDLTEFSSLPENSIPDVDVEDEAKLDQIAEVLVERKRRQQDFMRQRVRERSP